jgi:hypothetical protein
MVDHVERDEPGIVKAAIETKSSPSFTRYLPALAG